MLRQLFMKKAPTRVGAYKVWSSCVKTKRFIGKDPVYFSKITGDKVLLPATRIISRIPVQSFELLGGSLPDDRSML